MIVYILVAICVNQTTIDRTVKTEVTPSVLAFKSASLCLRNVEANYKAMKNSCNMQLLVECKERDLGK